MTGLIWTREGRVLLLAVVASLLVHTTVIGFFLNASIGTEPLTLPTSVRVNLVPAAPTESIEPVVDEVPEETPDEILPEPTVVETETVIPEEALPEEAAVTPEEFIAETENIEPVPELAEETPAPVTPLVEIPQVVIPSTETLVQSVRAVEQERVSRLWAYDCNARQQESDFITCDERSAASNAATVQRFSSRNATTSRTYQSLNPTREFTRAQRSLPTVSRNAPALAARLDAINIPEDLGEYLMQEVEAGITHNANAGNQTQVMQEYLTDQSDAAQQARQVLGDPLVRSLKNANQNRSVHINN